MAQVHATNEMRVAYQCVSCKFKKIIFGKSYIEPLRWYVDGNGGRHIIEK